jgi:TonB family protein
MASAPLLPARERPKWIAPAVIAGAVLLAVWLVWNALSGDRVGVQRPPAPQTTIDLLPPPPPPPPPPPEVETPPEPTDAPTPDPTPAPAPEPAPEAPAPVSIAGPAQAGSDAFGVRSGSGGGTGSPGSLGTCIGPNCGKAAGGGGVSDGFYRRYLGSALEQALRADRQVNKRIFNVTVMIWVSEAGQVTRAEIVKGTGEDRLDQIVLASLKAVGALEPPNGVKFPQRVVVRGTRGI